MGYIIFATGRRVTIDSAITGNAGTSTYSFRIRSGPNGITVPASGLSGFIGTSQATGSNGLVVNSSGQIRVYRSGTNLYGSTSALITTGVQFDYTLSHTAGSGAWDIFNNLTGTPTGESGTYTNAQLWSNGVNGLNQLGRSSSTSTVYLVGDMEIIAVTGLTNSQEYDASLSGGTGLTLPTTSGSNQGTLDNFGPTDADNWGGFGSSVSSSIAATWPIFSINASQSQSIPSVSSAVAATWPIFTVSANQSQPTAGVSSSISVTWPMFSVSANQSQATGFVSSVSVTWSMFSVSAVQSQSVPNVSSSVSATWPIFSVSAAQTEPGVIPAANAGAFVINAIVGGNQSILCRVGGSITNNAKIGGTLTNNAMVAA